MWERSVTCVRVAEGERLQVGEARDVGEVGDLRVVEGERLQVGEARDVGEVGDLRVAEVERLQIGEVRDLRRQRVNLQPGKVQGRRPSLPRFFNPQKRLVPVFVRHRTAPRTPALPSPMARRCTTPIDRPVRRRYPASHARL